MSTPTTIHADPLPWLLHECGPGVCYLALRDLAGWDDADAQLSEARQAAHREGPIAAILEQIDPAGFWAEPGPGYLPKYRSTVWSLCLLAQLGADGREDDRIGRACTYVLEQALTPGGQFTASGAPSGTADCLQGNLCWALLELGCTDPRLELAFDWLARSVTGEGVAPATHRNAAVRYYSGKCGPNFACGSNSKLPCAWGAVKVMLALGKWPAARRTPLHQRAIDRGVGFLLAGDPALAPYPNGHAQQPSGNWWKFGFPVFYITDLLQLVECLTVLGYGPDPRLAHALDIIIEKRDASGCWALEYGYAGKTWGDYGPKGQPNPWVTLRALRTLRRAGRSPAG